MSEYHISIIRPNHKWSMAQLEALLTQEGIERDANLDVTLGLFDQENNLVATGSCFQNTLRCLAVDTAHQGEGLMSQLVSELITLQFQRGNSHLFLYTKCDKAAIFRDLGFYEIAFVEDKLVFMENRRNGFEGYLAQLRRETALSGKTGTIHGAVVINANPFTLGHQYLLETAAKGCEVLHVFIVSEDVSLVPLAVREELVRLGSAHISNLIYHHTGSYMVSNATFPSYFLKDEDVIIRTHAQLDIAVFLRLATELGIHRRFVGEEPFSHVTGIYNQIMIQGLTQAGLDCVVIPRKESEGVVISASCVREHLRKGNFDALEALVPPTTLNYFRSTQAEPVMNAIRACEDVKHY